MINDGIPGEDLRASSRVPDVAHIRGGLIDTSPATDRARTPIVIWLEAYGVANPWAALEWGEDSVQDFVTALGAFFDNAAVPEPISSDIVVGVDKEDNVVALHVTTPITGGGVFEQKAAPANLK